MRFCTSSHDDSALSTAKGNKAEDAAVAFLQRNGYQILERNCRLGRGELDIIAELGELLVFIEVKGHRQVESSLLAMHQDKQHRLISAAQAWLSRHATYQSHQCRFDVVLVSASPFSLMPPHIQHLVDAFRL